MTARWDAMSFDDLTVLSNGLAAIVDAMSALQFGGLPAVADLTPGREAVLRLALTLPEAVAPITAVPAPDLTGFRGVAPVPGFEPDPPPPPTLLPGGGGSATAGEPFLPLSPQAAPAVATIAAKAVPAGKPISAFDSHANAWTQAEDATLCEIVASHLACGRSQRQAFGAAATALRRTEGARRQRAIKLDRRIARPTPATPTPVAEDPAQTGPQGTDTPPPAAGGADDAPPAPPPAAAACPAAVEPAPPVTVGTGGDVAPLMPEPAAAAATLSGDRVTDDLTLHLMAIPRPRPWTVEVDAELMRLACDGWKVHEIGADLRLSPDVVSRRFDLLTGLDRDTPTRRWPRAAVRDALADLCAPDLSWMSSPAAAQA